MNIKAPLVLGLCLVAAAGGYWLARQQAGPTPAPSEQHLHAASGTETDAQVYQCPMHPWIKSDRPGDRCTICGMELVAAGRGQAAATEVDPNLVTLTPAQAAVTGVQTAEVKRGSVTRTLRVSGVIDDDDTRHRILSARVPGRIEQLQVNYVGAPVEAGAPLATIYSPEMLTAQRQYLERIKAGAIATSQSDRAAARERLLELGLTDEEIGILDKTLKPTAMVSVRAPMSGTVVSRNVYEGQYVETNDRLFEIGDFSQMWFVFDAYEPDLAWLKPGQTVEISVPSLPGQVLTAPITFIDPNLSEMSRSARVRVTLDNPDRRLLHRQTGQALVLGTGPETLMVPRSAVLQHSGRPVVYVDQGAATARPMEGPGSRKAGAGSDQAAPGYRAQEIQLGRVGDTHAEVVSGLSEGHRVVTQAALILDSQAQLAHAAVGASGHDHSHGPARVAAGAQPHDEAAYGLLKALVFAAADAAAALAADDLAGYQQALPALREAQAAYLAGYAPTSRGTLGKISGKLVDGPDLDTARRAFEPVSTAVADLARGEHVHHREGISIFQCPMTPVLGTGRWLSRSDQLRNPFFGSAMLECGEGVQ